MREQPDCALHVLYRSHSIFLPNEPISLLILKTGVAFGSKGMVFSMSPDRAPLVRLASERFFRARSRPGPTGRHLPQRKLHCSPPPDKQKIREFQAENTCIDSGLMTKADDGSSGRSRMMRKSHVRFPEKGVATYWSFDQPPLVNSALGPPLTLPLL